MCSETRPNAKPENVSSNPDSLMTIFQLLYILTLPLIGSEFLVGDVKTSPKLSISVVEFKNQIEVSEKNVKFPVTIVIRNLQDSTVEFCTMTCSWEESFCTNDERVYIEPHQCDSNIPERIRIAPGNSVTYVGSIIVMKDYFVRKGCSFKVGLRVIPFKDFVYPNFPSRLTSYPIYWSDDCKMTNFQFW